MNKSKTPSLHREKKPATLWIYGKHACFSALQNPKRKIEQIFITKAMKEQVFALHDRSPVPKIVETAMLESLLGPHAVHQGIAISLSPLKEMDLEEWCDALGETHPPVMVLDQVTDIQNIGAILRSAAAFGVGALVLTEYNSPVENGAMAKAACGALERVPVIRAKNLVQALETLKKYGYWCAGMDGEATQPLSALGGFEKLAIVMGAEGKGLRRLTAKHCDLLVKIPISGDMESLNVSNAAAIALYEATRKHFLN